MQQPFLILDVDNCIVEKQKLDSVAYEKVSENIFGRIISMLYHPVTKEKDKEFPKHSNHKIWEYKIKQILESGEILRDKRTGKEIKDVKEVDINNLVSQLGEAAIKHLEESDNIDELINILINPSSLEHFALYTSAIGVASSGSRKIQERIIYECAFYEYGIDHELCTFAEEGKDKEKLIHKTTEKYFDKFGIFPSNIVYAGDSENDMKAIKNLKESYRNRFNYKGIGVLTGFSNETELYKGGADLVISNLKDKENLKKVTEYLRRLKNV